MGRLVDDNKQLYLCAKCKTVKHKSEFRMQDKTGDAKTCECTACYNKYQREYSKRIRKSRREEWFSNRSCVLCGETELVCLDFHHMNPADKDYPVSRMLKHSKSSVDNEIAKCAVLCSNCHRKVHAGIVTLDEKYKGCTGVI